MSSRMHPVDPDVIEPMTVDAASPLESRKTTRGLMARVLTPLATAALGRWQIGRLVVHLPDGETWTAGPVEADRTAVLRVHHERLLWRFALRGDVGVGESYVDGDWDADDLPAFIELALLNQHASGDTWLTKLATVPDMLAHLGRRNTRAGSRRNIGEHYDLSNDLFALFLDPSMTYSSAVFDAPDQSLEAAQYRKLTRFGDWLGLGPGDHVLEIGCGWGACALFLARTYGCRVTGITISQQQFDLASRRVQEAGLQDRIDIRFCDYRDVEGRYSHVISIEMLEAVGREHWATFFERCHARLAPGGLVGLQVISIPDHRFESYARRCDWIQKYIFPGGILPSLTELSRAMSRQAPFTVRHLEDIGPDYARTLDRWRRTFLARLADVRALGLDDRFIRTWDYYLASCEGAFRARAIGNLQLVLGRAV